MYQNKNMPSKEIKDYTPDIVLIGGGIMSATLGTLLNMLEPALTIEIFERLDKVAEESSAAWNNAGTGHSAYCELNYTPQTDGKVNISKAVKIAEQFEISKQFWAYLTQQGSLQPKDFIHHVPHSSIMFGRDNCDFLKRRHTAMTESPLFEDMLYSDEKDVLRSWFPLILQDRNDNEPVAATRMNAGTDVNFEALTHQLFAGLETKANVNLNLNHEVRDIDRDADGKWYLNIKDKATHERKSVTAKFVFIGAGGGALRLLEKAAIPEAEGYGGFPVSGQWLVCKNEALIQQHHAKVYGTAKVGTPPMSVPHLDTRYIDGSQGLLFGPFAGFSTKFLKHGSYLDLFTSIQLDNIKPMLQAGWDNLPLTRYLMHQVMQSDEDRMDALRAFIPGAKEEDWELKIAGQRVQVIKKDPEEGGILEFGTEIVASEDGSVAALLGASPGASTAVAIMLDLLKQCFPDKMATAQWQSVLKEMIPTFGKQLNEDRALCQATRQRSHEILGLAL